MTAETAEWLLLAAGIAGAAYLAWCAVLPFARLCPLGRVGELLGLRLCSRQAPRTSDSRGNYRRRRPCPCCGGRDWRRLGAVLIGAGRDGA